jgi:hypothetical protein
MKMMRRRIALSRVGATQGEFPFAVDGWILAVECPRRLQYFERPSGVSTEVIIGLFAREAELIWSDLNLVIWNIIKRRACFEAGPLQQRHAPSVKRCLFFAGCYRRCTIGAFNGPATHQVARSVPVLRAGRGLARTLHRSCIDAEARRRCQGFD